MNGAWRDRELRERAPVVPIPDIGLLGSVRRLTATGAAGYLARSAVETERAWWRLVPLPPPGPHY